jgi:methylated-DNA-[protein]-cysteine S-methyltransferase
MTIEIFRLEHIETPTGRMRIVTDDAGCLRAVDWDDHEGRMMKLLERHCGAGCFKLRDTVRPSEARRALEAYFEGVLSAIAALPTRTNGTAFQRQVWDALRSIPAGQSVS